MQINRKTLMWAIIGVLFLAVLFLSFKIGAGGDSVSTVGKVASVTANSMVGGC